MFDALQRALDDAKERILKEIDESSSETKARVEKELSHAREWKKEGEMLLRELNDLLSSQDDVLLMRNGHVLSPRIEGLLSCQPTMERVRETRMISNKQKQEDIIKVIESVMFISGLILDLFPLCPAVVHFVSISAL